MITQNIYHAAYAKVKGAKFGEITPGSSGMANIELVGDDQKIEQWLSEYELNGQVPVKKYLDELGFIKYLVKNKCN